MGVAQQIKNALFAALVAAVFLGLTVGSVLLSSEVYVLELPLAIGGVPFKVTTSGGEFCAVAIVILTVVLIAYFLKGKKAQ